MKKIFVKTIVFVIIALLLSAPTTSRAAILEFVNKSQDSQVEVDNTTTETVESIDFNETARNVTSKSFNEISREFILDDADEGVAPSYRSVIGAAITLTQVIGVFIAFIMIMYVTICIITLTVKIKNLEREEVEVENKEELLAKYRKNLSIHKGRVLAVVIIAGLIIFCNFILQTIKQFAKPIIYIYPEEDGTEVTVSLENPEILTCTYPKYNDGWKVTADKDGTLTDETGRKYYALYWEGDNKTKESFEDGFVVKGENTAKFLEEKLEILGLNEREAEEFIVYWLPKLEKNRYNLIRFKTTEEMNEEAKLNISPEPDTLIRVMMEYKPLLIKKDIKEQALTKVERKGYTVVEWGATEY